jgi:hypothetical protein
LRKLRADFEAAGLAASDTDLRRKLDELMERAIAEVQAGR